jgi:hypothetical protein
MPKEWAMSQLKQISRPFQIAFVATVLLFALWLVVLRNHSSSGKSAAPATSAAQPASRAHATGSSSASSGASGAAGSSGSSASGSSTYHGSAPGVAGLTRAIAKARGAVAASEHNARQLQGKENQASDTSTQSQKSSSHSSPAATAAKPPVKTASAPVKTAPSSAAKTPASPSVKKPSTSGARVKAGIPAMQSKVEAQLKHGQLVAILLWNPKGSVDKVVHRELQAASHAFGGKLTLHVAPAAAVGSFGTFTRTVQVYSTPTILLINHNGATSSVTGLTDVFSIEQAVREAERAS